MSSANPVLDFATGIAGFDPSMISTARPNQGGHDSPFYLATSGYALSTAIAGSDHQPRLPGSGSSYVIGSAVNTKRGLGFLGDERPVNARETVQAHRGFRVLHA